MLSAFLICSRFSTIVLLIIGGIVWYITRRFWWWSNAVLIDDNVWVFSLSYVICWHCWYRRALLLFCYSGIHSLHCVAPILYFTLCSSLLAWCCCWLVIRFHWWLVVICCYYCCCCWLIDCCCCCCWLLVIPQSLFRRHWRYSVATIGDDLIEDVMTVIQSLREGDLFDIEALTRWMTGGWQ